MAMFRRCEGTTLKSKLECLGSSAPMAQGKTRSSASSLACFLQARGKHGFGHDVLHDRIPIRKMLGYLPQEFGAYPKLTGLELE